MSAAVVIKDKRFRPFISEQSIAVAVKGVAESINAELVKEFPLFLVVLNGAFMFASDLLKEVDIPCEVSFIRVSSYEGTASTGKVNSIMGISEELKDRTVVIVEDIVDTGRTLDFLVNDLRGRGVRTLRVATALLKPDRYKSKQPVDYVGFSIPDDFVVGYGMDYDGQGRNLKDIHVLA
jgi:hypoxanthine phosphoribosyltransferase